VFLINTLLTPTSLQRPADSNIHSTPAAPVHPNSHASMLSDPSSSETSPATLIALREHGLLGALVSALTAPTPYGEDGESEGDANFEEIVVRSVFDLVSRQENYLFMYLFYVIDCCTLLRWSVKASSWRRRNNGFVSISINSSK
jgi:hypothetical protein